MSDAEPQTVICTYKVKPGKEADFEALLRKHWPTLRDNGLVTDTPPRFFRGKPSHKPEGRHGAERTYIEIYEWKNARAVELAHASPRVMAVWEPMGACCDEMDFPHFEPLTLLDG